MTTNQDSSKVIQVWCEYDIGQESYVFKTLEAAKAWVEGQVAVHMPDNTATFLAEEGLVGYEEITLVG